MRTRQVHHLAKGYATDREGQPIYSWPYVVDYAPGNPGGEFYLEEGDARNGSGGFFPAASLLLPLWRSHLEITGALWLLPFLERMAQGEQVPPEEILEAYRRIHNALPTPEERTIY